MKMRIFSLLGILMLTLLVANVESEKENAAAEINMCKSDTVVTSMCLACTKLPYGMAMPFKSCCHDYQVMEMCDLCTINPQKCMNDVFELESKIIEQTKIPISNENLEDAAIDPEEEDGLEINKRYGRVFFGNRPFLFSGYYNKRFGRLFFGKRPLSNLPRYRFAEKQKRSGKLFLQKKSAEINEYKRVNKRYGRLFMTPYIDNRYGSANHPKPPPPVRYYWK